MSILKLITDGHRVGVQVLSPADAVHSQGDGQSVDQSEGQPGAHKTDPRPGPVWPQQEPGAGQ